MSHDIDTTTGQTAVFVTGEPAWHRLGTVIDSAATSGDAIKLAHLDWSVEQWPVQAAEPNTDRIIEATDRVANVRTDTHAVLGVVSRQYHVFQNAEAFDFMDAIVGDKLAMFETAGALHEGRRVWMLARSAASEAPMRTPRRRAVSTRSGSAAATGSRRRRTPVHWSWHARADRGSCIPGVGTHHTSISHTRSPSWKDALSSFFWSSFTSLCSPSLAATSPTPESIGTSLGLRTRRHRARPRPERWRHA